MPITIRNYKKYQVKPFPHFDQRIHINKTVKKNLRNTSYISTHSFYPFIHYTKVTRKYNKKERMLSDPKKREIFYASHMDGYIFKYYSELLNIKYNSLCINTRIDDVSLAYRDNKRGKNNIHFASDVINFISEQKEAFIFVSDFSSYFDNLDHELLKDKLINVLGTKSRLTKDWWNIFKHITQYSWVEKEELAKDLESTQGRKITDESNKERYYAPREFREFRKRVRIKKNKTGKGIPQGTAISAVLANIYAIDLDQKLNQYALNLNGIYRRYSDDIILVLPIAAINKNVEDQAKKHISYIKQTIKDNKIIIGDSKTKDLFYLNKKIYEDPRYQVQSKLDYLGFTFDGINVKVREKSMFKYYHRTYKKIASVNIASINKGKRVGRKKLYSLYTHLGIRYKGYGNFISYCKRAHTIFEKNKKIDSLINKQIKKHWNKIQKRLSPLDKQ